LLDHADGVEVVGEASNLEAAVRQVAARRPEVLVVDLRMPDGFSAERMRRLRMASPATEIVVTTMHASEMFSDEALRAGAIGFVLADTADRELVEAVRRAGRRLRYRSPRIRPAVA
jgi:DNA-binding NarL/FixJ family response regulator